MQKDESSNSVVISGYPQFVGSSIPILNQSGSVILVSLIALLGALIAGCGGTDKELVMLDQMLSVTGRLDGIEVVDNRNDVSVTVSNVSGFVERLSSSNRVSSKSNKMQDTGYVKIRSGTNVLYVGILDGGTYVCGKKYFKFLSYAVLMQCQVKRTTQNSTSVASLMRPFAACAQIPAFDTRY
jgi:hypothetical protein